MPEYFLCLNKVFYVFNFSISFLLVMLLIFFYQFYSVVSCHVNILYVYNRPLISFRLDTTNIRFWHGFLTEHKMVPSPIPFKSNGKNKEFEYNFLNICRHFNLVKW